MANKCGVPAESMINMEAIRDVNRIMVIRRCFIFAKILEKQTTNENLGSINDVLFKCFHFLGVVSLFV